MIFFVIQISFTWQPHFLYISLSSSSFLWFPPKRTFCLCICSIRCKREKVAKVLRFFLKLNIEWNLVEKLLTACFWLFQTLSRIRPIKGSLSMVMRQRCTYCPLTAMFPALNRPWPRSGFPSTLNIEEND